MDFGLFKDEKQTEHSCENHEIMEDFRSISDVSFRCTSARDEDRELILLENGLVAIRRNSEGELCDIHKNPIEFGKHGGFYRITIKKYGLRVSKTDFEQFLKAYNQLRDPK